MGKTFMMPSDLAKYFDHTLLNPTASKDQIIKLCAEAVHYEFYSVCVNPIWVETCSKLLKSKDVKVCSVVGFPFGANNISSLTHETIAALNDGADEIDMVANPGLLLTRKKAEVSEYFRRIETLTNLVHKYSQNNKKILKVIIESELLSDEDIRFVCNTCREIGVDFVKTSTGYAPIENKGATEHAVALIKSLSKDTYKVKASGGIKTLGDALTMIRAGANRIGASSSVNIIKEFTKSVTG